MAKKDAVPAAPLWRKRRLLRGSYRLLRLAVLLVLLAILSMWGYCRWMENFLERQLHFFWAEDVFTIDRVSFSPWSHEFTLYGLCWHNPPGYDRSRKAIEIRRVHADLELDMLSRRTLHFRNVEISDVRLNMEFRSRSLAKLALLLEDPAPEVNLFEAIQFQLAGGPEETDAGESRPLFRAVRIDTLAVGESQVTFGNLDDIPGLNVLLNLQNCLSLSLRPYRRYGIGFDRSMAPGEVLDEIIDCHFHKIQQLMRQRLSPTGDAVSRWYQELFSGQLRECERHFEDIRDWNGLLAAVRTMEKIDHRPELAAALEKFLEHYPHTQAVAKRLRDDLKAYAAGVISAEELHRRQEFIRRSRNARQAVEEWNSPGWWQIGK